MRRWNSAMIGFRSIVLAPLLLACVYSLLLHALPKFALGEDIASAHSDQAEEPEIGPSDREHWSFAPLLNSPVPDVAAQPLGVAPRNDIDCFILEKLQALELGLAQEAQPRHLLRRLAFDLTGLPPTDELLESFQENAPAPDGYERAVDRLLASPSLGEHAAQSWLDLARFAETDGFEHDKVRPQAWRYRDWVIGALNDDMPYDLFMRMQVAGDLTEEPLGAIATTFCLAGPDMPDVNDQLERRHNLLNEMTGTVGGVFLGLQLGCAACHDHKYDPISQADFYRLRGVLESGVAELQRDKPWAVMQEQEQLPTPYLFQHGDHRQRGVRLVPGVPRIAVAPTTAKMVATSAQPRIALADWLSSSENPLSARAMANRIWQSHFGRGLAATPSDLGLVGIGPTHAGLIDTLAVQFVEGDWSVKRLRRKILQSATYRQASLADEFSQEAFAVRVERDPENNLLSRYPRRRLTGEMLRDAMLTAAGLIDRQAYGVSVMPPLPGELLSTILPGQWNSSKDPADHCRRSIYVFARRNLRLPIFETFDRPDAGVSCPERSRSVTATQSLLLFNSEFSLKVAASLADQASENESLQDQIEALWQRGLGRSATAMECELLKEFVDTAPERRQALRAAALALLNSNEFVTID